MSEEHQHPVRRIYGVLLSAVLIAAGMCLITACVSIYRSGDHSFSREAVAAHFAPISPVVYLCLAMVIGGFLLDWILPPAPKKNAAGRQDPQTLARLRAKTDLAACDEALQAAVNTQRKRQRLCRILCGGVMAVCALVFLCYALDSRHFRLPDINGSMIQAMAVLLPCLVASLVSAIVCVYFCRACIRREIGLLKQAPAGKAPRKAESDKKPRANPQRVLRYAFAVLGIGLLLYGFFTGGTADVLTKAINICTECVGLG